MIETHLLTSCPILSLIASLYALLLFHRTSLLTEILYALVTTSYTGHYHYVKMLVDNANSIGANIPIENQSAKQHLIPALKAWKAENLGTTIVYTRLAYDKWKGTEYVLAFGDNIATRVIAHNGRSCIEAGYIPFGFGEGHTMGLSIEQSCIEAGYRPFVQTWATGTRYSGCRI